MRIELTPYRSNPYVLRFYRFMTLHLILINLENLQPPYKESTLQSSPLKIQRNKESCCSLSSSPSMSSTCSSLHQVTNTKKKLKGVRRRKWGKWVSEIRVPGTQERLWLGTYATAEAAAVAHDVAVYCLRKPSSLSLEKLNFPQTLSSYGVQNRNDMSPKSIQKVASDVGMDVDARNIAGKTSTVVVEQTKNEGKNGDGDIFWWEKMGDDSEGSEEGEDLSISVEDYL